MIETSESSRIDTCRFSTIEQFTVSTYSTLVFEYGNEVTRLHEPAKIGGSTTKWMFS